MNKPFGTNDHTEAYTYLTEQMKATGRQRGEGYDSAAWDCLTDAEKDQLEGKIWRKYFFGDNLVGVYLPKLRRHNGVRKLASSLKHETEAEPKAFLADILYRATGDDCYLDVMRQCCADERGARVVAVNLREYPAYPKTEELLRAIFVNSADEGTQLTALVGILHQRGIIQNVNDNQEFMEHLSLIRKLHADDASKRRMLLDEFLNESSSRDQTSL